MLPSNKTVYMCRYRSCEIISAQHSPIYFSKYIAPHCTCKNVDMSITAALSNKSIHQGGIVLTQTLKHAESPPLRSYQGVDQLPPVILDFIVLTPLAIPHFQTATQHNHYQPARYQTVNSHLTTHNCSNCHFFPVLITRQASGAPSRAPNQTHKRLAKDTQTHGQRHKYQEPHIF